MDNTRNHLQELSKRLVDLSTDLQALEGLLELDIPSSLNKIRFITEKSLHKLCKSREVSWGQAEPTLERMIGPLVSTGYIPKNIAIYVRTIQAYTSPGSHYQESALSNAHVRFAQEALLEFLQWYATLPEANSLKIDVETPQSRKVPLQKRRRQPRGVGILEWTTRLLRLRLLPAGDPQRSAVDAAGGDGYALLAEGEHTVKNVTNGGSGFLPPASKIYIPGLPPRCQPNRKWG